MSPEDCIAALDDALADDGQDVVLRRVVGQGAGMVNVDVVCRAVVRPYRLREDELAGGISQTVLLVSISPTQIATAQWPGGSMPGQTVAPSLPRRNDKMIIDGRLRNVEACVPISIGNVAVRYDLSVTG